MAKMEGAPSYLGRPLGERTKNATAPPELRNLLSGGRTSRKDGHFAHMSGCLHLHPDRVLERTTKPGRRKTAQAVRRSECVSRAFRIKPVVARHADWTNSPPNPGVLERQICVTAEKRARLSCKCSIPRGPGPHLSEQRCQSMLAVSTRSAPHSWLRPGTGPATAEPSRESYRVSGKKRERQARPKGGGRGTTPLAATSMRAEPSRHGSVHPEPHAATSASSHLPGWGAALSSTSHHSCQLTILYDSWVLSLYIRGWRHRAREKGTAGVGRRPDLRTLGCLAQDLGAPWRPCFEEQPCLALAPRSDVPVQSRSFGSSGQVGHDAKHTGYGAVEGAPDLV